VFKNSGQPTCLGLLPAVPKKAILVPKFKADGTLNKIVLPATLNQAYFDALINHTDRTQRWYPLPKFVNPENTKAEAVYESFNDGSKKFVHDGVRTFKAKLPSISPAYVQVINSGRCAEMALYFVDKNGSLLGTQVEGDTSLYPFALNANTLNAMYDWTNDTTGSNIDFSFEFDTDMLDSDIAWIKASDTVSVNLLNLEGLYDAYKLVANTGQTTTTFSLFARNGNAINGVPIKGLIITDFAFYNVTTSTAITLLTLVESTVTPGTYTATYASQTIGNVIRITPTKAKIDFSNIVLQTQTVA
jgi:hypothetical protein